MEQNIKDILISLKIPGKILTKIEEAIKAERLTLIPSEEHTLLFNFPEGVIYEFYCADFFEDDKIENPVSFLDIFYSRHRSNALGAAKNLAGRANSDINRLNFEIEADEDIRNLVCLICDKINDKEYEKYKTIADIDKPVPIEVFIGIFNNQNDTEKIVFNASETRMAGLLANIEIRTSMMGTSFLATFEFMARNGKGEFVKTQSRTRINPSSYLVTKLEDLGIELLTVEEEKALIERGRKYIEITEKPYYCKYDGVAFSDGWRGDDRHNINSRIMLDLNAMAYLNPDIDSDWYYGNITRNEKGSIQPDYDLLWAMSPVVYGFCFGNKQWCRFSVDSISEIKFSETAFKDLIIPEENKELFIACMTHDMPSLDDIEDKGAGKIFLLHGAPGVGKTMTAEATAEHLKKPLYFVSVGELGTDPQQLERSLEKVMSIASSWDAVVLLDEVDVFAVDRKGASIERNAMTAIFLRTLERYSGIMFMTTNLIDNLDPAFVSRATAVIGYEELSEDDRAAIWTKVIGKATSLGEITIADDVYENIKHLAQNYRINGRLIKNTVRLAYTLALSRDKVLTVKDLGTALDMRK